MGIKIEKLYIILIYIFSNTYHSRYKYYLRCVFYHVQILLRSKRCKANTYFIFKIENVCEKNWKFANID